MQQQNRQFWKNGQNNENEDDNITISSGQSGPKRSYFEVEKIVGKKKINKKLHYFVKWKKYPKTQNTWEPIENLQNATDLIEEFEEKISAKLQSSVPQQPRSGIQQQQQRNSRYQDQASEGGSSDEQYRIQKKVHKSNEQYWGKAIKDKQIKRKVRRKKVSSEEQSEADLISINSEVSDPRKNVKTLNKMRASNIEEPVQQPKKRGRKPKKLAQTEKESKKKYQQELNLRQMPQSDNFYLIDDSGDDNKRKPPLMEIEKQQIPSHTKAQLINSLVEGSYSEGDMPESVASCKQHEGLILMTVKWRPRINGIQPLPRVYSSKQLRKIDPELLIDYYESKLKFLPQDKKKAPINYPDNTANHRNHYYQETGEINNFQENITNKENNNLQEIITNKENNNLQDIITNRENNDLQDIVTNKENNNFQDIVTTRESIDNSNKSDKINNIESQDLKDVLNKYNAGDLQTSSTIPLQFHENKSTVVPVQFVESENLSQIKIFRENDRLVIEKEQNGNIDEKNLKSLSVIFDESVQAIPSTNAPIHELESPHEYRDQQVNNSLEGGSPAINNDSQDTKLGQHGSQITDQNVEQPNQNNNKQTIVQNIQNNHQNKQIEQLINKYVALNIQNNHQKQQIAEQINKNIQSVEQTNQNIEHRDQTIEQTNQNIQNIQQIENIGKNDEQHDKQNEGKDNFDNLEGVLKFQQQLLEQSLTSNLQKEKIFLNVMQNKQNFDGKQFKELLLLGSPGYAKTSRFSQQDIQLLQEQKILDYSEQADEYPIDATQKSNQ